MQNIKCCIELEFLENLKSTRKYGGDAQYQRYFSSHYRWHVGIHSSNTSFPLPVPISSQGIRLNNSALGESGRFGLKKIPTAPGFLDYTYRLVYPYIRINHAISGRPALSSPCACWRQQINQFPVETCLSNGLQVSRFFDEVNQFDIPKNCMTSWRMPLHND